MNETTNDPLSFKDKRSFSSSLGLVFLLFLSLPGTAAAIGKTIEIAKNGETPYVIVIPDADGKRIAPAAELLREVVEKAADVKLPIVSESEKAGYGPAFYLGKTKTAKAAGLPLEKVKGWAFFNRTLERNVFIVGDDEDFPLEGMKQRYHGTLKAVTAFLEEQLGVRFLLPGEYGRRIPKNNPLVVDAHMDSSGNLRFEYVIGRAPRKDKVFAAALNLFRHTPVFRTYSGHSYYDAVPKKTHQKPHPEYFALRGGVRTPDNNHLCLSNPEVRELMLKEMERELNKGYQWIELCQTDGYKACRCEGCSGLHSNEGERIWITHRELAEKLEKRCPGKKVVIGSYSPTRLPPRSFDSFPDNAMIKMCHYSPESFEAWKRFDVGKVLTVYNWGDYKTLGMGPTRTPTYAVEQVRRLLNNGVGGLYLCGGYDPGAGYGLNGPVFYVFGKALANPELDPDNVLEEYVNALFGESAAPMRAFYRKMYDRLAVYSLFDSPNVATNDVPNSFGSPEDYYCHCFPPKLLKDMTLNLERAKRLATDEKVKAALGMVELEFNYVKYIAMIFHLHRAYRVNPTPEALDALAGKIAEWRGFLDSLYDETGKRPPVQPGGLPTFFNGVSKARALMNGRVMGLQPPFNWDFDLLKKRRVLPGAGEPKKLSVSKASPIKLDGDLDEPVWKKVPFQDLGEIGMGKARDATRFKAARDDQAFYVAVECEFHSTDWMKHLKKTGKDGAAWAQECVELCVDPWGEREKHYQLVFSPVPDSTFDARRGAFGDPLNPYYGKTDAGWDGDWTYAAKINEENKRWTAEARIPFATLGIDSPESGNVWTFNIARTQWPQGYGKAHYCQTWAPNLEGRDYHDRSSFGELTFE